MRKENKVSKKLRANYEALVAKTAKKLIPELSDYKTWNRKGDMLKFEKNVELLLNSKYGIIPMVGMGATTGAGSDCYPHTIVAVGGDFSHICTTSDSHEATEKSDYYGSQDYTYTTNWDARRQLWTLRKDGNYYPEGVGMGRSYNSISIGHRRYYQDPSF